MKIRVKKIAKKSVKNPKMKIRVKKIIKKVVKKPKMKIRVKKIVKETTKKPKVEIEKLKSVAKKSTNKTFGLKYQVRGGFLKAEGKKTTAKVVSKKPIVEI